MVSPYPMQPRSGVLGPTPGQPPQGILGPRIPWGQNPVVTMAALGLVSGNSLNEGLSNMASMVPAGMAAKTAMQKDAQTRQDEARRRAALNAWLRSKSGLALSPEEQEIIASSPDVGEALFKTTLAQQLEKPPQTADITNYNFAKQQGFQGTFQDWLASGASGTTEYGLNPIYGKDAQGNPVVLQPSKAGGLRQADVPPGVTLTPGVDKIDLGTHWGILNRAGDVVGTIPKDVAGEAAQTEVGKASGIAQADLPSAIGKAETALRTIDLLRNHPGRVGGTGGSAWLTNIPGTQEYNFGAALKQAQGQVFLTAYQDLKGGGAITTIEGEKAEQAIARLDKWQTEEEFLSALNDLEEVVKAGLARAKAKAGQPSPEPGAGATQAVPPTATAPAAGKLIYTSPAGGKVYAE